VQFAFTEDQVLFRDTVRDFLANECKPEAVRAAWENDTGRIPGMWQQLCEMGVIGLVAPESSGGFGMSELDLVGLLEETGRAALPEPIVEHAAVAVPLLRDHHAHADEWLSRAASGEALVGVALARSPYVAYADQAEALLLAHGDDVYLVPRGAVTLTAQRAVDFSRRLFSVQWTTGDGMRIARGDEGRQAQADAFNRGALGASAQLIGLAQQMVDVTVDYVGQREQFGKVVGSFQAVKHHMSNALLAVEFARPMVYVAAYAVANATPHRDREVSIAMAMASEAADRVCRLALQCHGAIGYTFEYDLHLWMKRAWALSTAWGDAPFHQDRVATALGL
jgi:alkylation response protein AidB-like acyl-CoA dehydrogenase